MAITVAVVQEFNVGRGGEKKKRAKLPPWKLRPEPWVAAWQPVSGYKSLGCVKKWGVLLR